MRLRIKQARPTNLNDAVRHAVELETCNKAEEKRGDCYGYIRTTVPTRGNSNTDNAITELLKKMQSALTRRKLSHLRMLRTVEESKLIKDLHINLTTEQV